MLAASAQVGMPPQEAEALGDTAAQRGRVALAFLLERGAHGQERNGGCQIGAGVDEEGKGPAQAEQRPAQGRPGQLHRGRPPRLRGGRGRQLGGRHDAPEGAALGRGEHRRAASLHEGDQGDGPQGDVMGQDGRAQGGQGGEAEPVGADHQPSARPAVGGQPGGQHPQHLSQGAGGGHDAGIGGRPGEGQDQQRVGDGRGLGPDVRQELARLQQHEVAVAPQGRGLHSGERIWAALVRNGLASGAGPAVVLGTRL